MPQEVDRIELQHARRTQQRWALDGEPLTGVSVFCALDSTGPASLDGLLRGRMRSYRVVHQVPVGRLLNGGFELVPTAGRPHYTVRMDSDDEGEAAKLLALLGTPRDNQYRLSSARPTGDENK